jgi:hypothetical protein
MCGGGRGGSTWVTWPSRMCMREGGAGRVCSGGGRGGGGQCSWWVPRLVVMVVGDVAGGPLVFSCERAVV